MALLKTDAKMMALTTLRALAVTGRGGAELIFS